MRVVLAPMNFAMMPVTIAAELRRRGYDAKHVQYSGDGSHRFDFQMDHVVRYKELGGRIPAQFATLETLIDEGWDIFHFWNKSLVFRGNYHEYTGLDLPLLKARGRRIAHRFTGYDLRLPSWDKEANPHSPFHHGLEPLWDEELQKLYIGFMKEYVDQFIVQDPELHHFFPEAKIIPRALDLQNWEFVGVTERTKRRPLVVHAPTSDVSKGTKYVMEAFDALQAEGLSFDYKLIRNMSQKEAQNWYKRADIVVDQILIGATGVLTLEAWALGKPVVVYLQEDRFNAFYGTDDLPIVNATPPDIKEKLRDIIQDYPRREELSHRGRKLVEDFHDISKVVDQYIDTYKDMMARPVKQPDGVADIAYFMRQTQMLARTEANARNFQKRFTAERVDFRRYRARIEKGLPPVRQPGPVEESLMLLRRAWRRRVKALMNFFRRKSAT